MRKLTRYMYRCRSCSTLFGFQYKGMKAFCPMCGVKEAEQIGEFVTMQKAPLVNKEQE